MSIEHDIETLETQIREHARAINGLLEHIATECDGEIREDGYAVIACSKCGLRVYTNDL